MCAASRGDLYAARDGPAFGAIDSKITSAAMMAKATSVAYGGPTHETQPAFSWTGKYANQTAYPHWGQPTTWDFPWVTMAGGPLGANATRFYRPVPAM